MKPVPDIMVVGTDTGVGKSVVSLLLMQLLYARGYTPFYLKPFQTGCVDPLDSESDAAFVYRHTTALRQKNPASSVIHCFPNPKAPLFAARDAGAKSISLDKVLRMVALKRRKYTPLIVEAAGGLLVPLTETHMVVDLISRSDCRPLLVARSGLGTINHTLLSIEAMQRREITPLGIVFVESGQSLEDPALVAQNIEAVTKISSLRVGGIVPGIIDFDEPAEEAYHPLENILP